MLRCSCVRQILCSCMFDNDITLYIVIKYTCYIVGAFWHATLHVYLAITSKDFILPISYNIWYNIIKYTSNCIFDNVIYLIMLVHSDMLRCTRIWQILFTVMGSMKSFAVWVPDLLRFQVFYVYVFIRFMCMFIYTFMCMFICNMYVEYL